MNKFTVLVGNEMLGTQRYVGSFDSEEDAVVYASLEISKTKNFATYELWTGTAKHPGRFVRALGRGTASAASAARSAARSKAQIEKDIEAVSSRGSLHSIADAPKYSPGWEPLISVSADIFRDADATSEALAREIERRYRGASTMREANWPIWRVLVKLPSSYGFDDSTEVARYASDWLKGYQIEASNDKRGSVVVTRRPVGNSMILGYFRSEDDARRWIREAPHARD